MTNSLGQGDGKPTQKGSNLKKDHSCYMNHRPSIHVLTIIWRGGLFEREAGLKMTIIADRTDWVNKSTSVSALVLMSLRPRVYVKQSLM